MLLSRPRVYGTWLVSAAIGSAFVLTVIACNDSSAVVANAPVDATALPDAAAPVEEAGVATNPDAAADAAADVVEITPVDPCLSLSCDDGDVCTTDSCAAGACVHVPVVPASGSITLAATGAIQTFTASACVRTITVEASGAQGGSTSGQSHVGGLGATTKGDFVVTEGLALSVLVGAAGGNAQYVGGGGGGSFVWNPASAGTPLLVAGGGGGAGYSTDGGPGLTSAAGGNGVDTTAGAGTAGSGGVEPTPKSNWAAGGAGWLSDGAGAGGTSTASCGRAAGGKSPANGGAGGAGGGNNTGAGGFGGGGGAQGQCTATAGGGGGGYSGGGAGTDRGTTNFTGGGGGGSFNAGANPTSVQGAHAGAGSVTISW